MLKGAFNTTIGHGLRCVEDDPNSSEKRRAIVALMHLVGLLDLRI